MRKTVLLFSLMIMVVALGLIRGGAQTSPTPAFRADDMVVVAGQTATQELLCDAIYHPNGPGIIVVEGLPSFATKRVRTITVTPHLEDVGESPMKEYAVTVYCAHTTKPVSTIMRIIVLNPENLPL